MTDRSVTDPQPPPAPEPVTVSTVRREMTSLPTRLRDQTRAAAHRRCRPT